MITVIKFSNIFLRKNKFSSVFFLVVILFAVLVVFSMFLLKNAGRADAQVSSFYSTSCLGGWRNTDKAEGVPDVTQENDENYSMSNSAFVYNTSAQIYCGDFEGEIPNDALNKKVLVKFSWATSSLDAVAPESSQSSKDEDAGTEPTEQEGQIESEIIPEETINETSSEGEIVPPDTLPPSETEPEVETVEETAPETETEPKELPPDESLIYFSIPVAYAEELTTEEETDIKNAEEKSQPETLSNIPPGTILEALYTLDDTNWIHLSYIETIDDNGSFELPAEFFATTEDLNKVQIALHTISNYDSQQVIYLDSVWLEVEYEQAVEERAEDSSQVATALEGVENEEQNLEEEQQDEEVLEDEVIEEMPEEAEEVLPEEIIEEEIITEEKAELIPNPVEMPPPLPWPPLSIRNFTKNIIIDPSARHSCVAKSFTVDISMVDIYLTSFFLVKSGDSIYKLEIGSLPAGIDITFSKNNLHSYEPMPSETEIDLKIVNEDGSRKGNFSVTVYFTKKGATDSSVTCQINVVNE